MLFDIDVPHPCKQVSSHTLLLCTTILFADSAILQACYIAACAVHAAAMHMRVCTWVLHSVCLQRSTCHGTSYCLFLEGLFDCQRICSNIAITANLVSHTYMHIYMEDTPAMHACLHERGLCQTVVLLQAQVTDLVLQRFQSAETADLPAVLRFLLQHVDSQNASQVLHLCALHATPEYQVGPPLFYWGSF